MLKGGDLDQWLVGLTPPPKLQPCELLHPRLGVSVTLCLSRHMDEKKTCFLTSASQFHGAVCCAQPHISHQCQHSTHAGANQRTAIIRWVRALWKVTQTRVIIEFLPSAPPPSAPCWHLKNPGLLVQRAEQSRPLRAASLWLWCIVGLHSTTSGSIVGLCSNAHLCHSYGCASTQTCKSAVKRADLWAR